MSGGAGPLPGEVPIPVQAPPQSHCRLHQQQQRPTQHVVNLWVAPASSWHLSSSCLLQDAHTRRSALLCPALSAVCMAAVLACVCCACECSAELAPASCPCCHVTCSMWLRCRLCRCWVPTRPPLLCRHAHHFALCRAASRAPDCAGAAGAAHSPQRSAAGAGAAGLQAGHAHKRPGRQQQQRQQRPPADPSGGSWRPAGHRLLTVHAGDEPPHASGSCALHALHVHEPPLGGRPQPSLQYRGWCPLLGRWAGSLRQSGA